ncbi:hypothetical protein BGZ49_007121 [Haplosporangium sp. Z 27]|nr:hypothetical protein BGZ49_007121 [Haplosporangium sp. Z 27]
MLYHPTDTDPTSTRLLMECEGTGFSLNLDNPYSSFEASYKLFNPEIPRSDSVLFDPAFKTPTSTVSMLSQQHLWSDTMFDESCIPFRQMAQNLSPPTSISSDSQSSSSSNFSNHSSFRSRMSSISSDNLISNPEISHSHTHEYNVVFDNLVPSKKSNNSDPDLPSLAPDSPTPDSLMPSDTIVHAKTMNKIIHNDDYHQFNLHGEANHADQEMSDDQHESSMDVDTDDDSNDEGDETNSSKVSYGSRESSSTSEGTLVKTRPTRASTRSAALAAKSKSSLKSSSRAKKSSRSKSTSASRKVRNASNDSSHPRKHSSPEEESSEAKRQKFLERNRMAASKCREKKRLQTLKTISDADAITARNQALHESLDSLQEEVRSLKNQILCHRDCGCDVIQKFVQSSFGTPSFRAGSNPQSSGRSHAKLC